MKTDIYAIYVSSLLYYYKDVLLSYIKHHACICRLCSGMFMFK